MFSLTNYVLWHPSMGPFVKSSCFLLIVYLLGFVIASYEALCVYIKTCLTPSASSEEPQTSKDNSKTVEPMTPAHRWRLILGLLIFTALTCLQFVNLQRGDFQFGQILLNHIGSLYYLISILVVGKMAISLSTMFVNRDTLLKPSPWVAFFVASIIYFAIIVGLGLYGPNTEPSVWVVTLSLVYFVSGGNSGKVMPRWKRVCGFWAAYTLWTLIDWYNFIQISTENQSQDGEVIWPRLTFQGIYVAFIPAALASFGSGILIARMLRFDFKNHLDRGWLSLTTRRPGESNKPQGVVINVGSDLFAIRFPKPYFTVAIITWILIRIVTIGLCLTTGFPAESPYDACFYTALIEFPIMMAAIFLLGVVRGETNVLRDYEENWTPKSDKATQVDVIMTSANDEKFV